jgi:hypothetical protein
MFLKIGIFGSCQIFLTSNFFLNTRVCRSNKLKVLFSLPFYEYDDKYNPNKLILDYTIFNNLDILIIENNNLENQASSKKIIEYCLAKGIKVIKTCLIKFPIFPINWSGYGINIKDIENYPGLENIDYNERFKICIKKLEDDITNSDLTMDLLNFIKNNFNKTLLFTHSLHPTNILLHELWKEIFKCLSININHYRYIYKNELIDCWRNPFTTKMIKDLDITFNSIISDEFYVKMYKDDTFLKKVLSNSITEIP